MIQQRGVEPMTSTDDGETGDPEVDKFRSVVDVHQRRSRRWQTAAAKVPTAAQKVISDVVALLAGLVQRLRIPLLVLLLAPVGPALVLVVVSTARGGGDVGFAWLLGALGLIPSGWLAVRRAQLLHALQPPARAAAEIYAAINSADTLSRLRSNLAPVVRADARLRLRSVSRKIWQGVKLTADVRSRMGSSPRLAPFLPGRLRGLALLSGWCLLSFVVLGGLAVVKALASAVGIG